MRHTVSIIVPVYKVEPYLERCVKSILAQSYTDWELILVDDGSPDHCPEMCDTYATEDKRIKVIHKANAGLGMARNTGLDAATGDYIFFFDSDDYVAPTIAEKCIASALENESDAVIFGYSDCSSPFQYSSHSPPNEWPNSCITTLFQSEFGFL